MPKNIIKLIIIRGPLGIGKTTVAKLLAQKLSGQYVSIDDILHKNKLDLTEDIPLKNFLKVNEIIAAKYKNCHRTLIVDGNFYFKKQIIHLKKKLPGAKYIFTLQAPLWVCMKRNRRRGPQYSDDAARAVFKLVNRFDYGIQINTKDSTPGDIVKFICKFARRRDLQMKTR